MNILTDRQQAILDFIEAHLAREGLPPTHEDIALAFGFSQPRAAGFHLRALAQKGAIALQPGKARGIRVLRPAPAPAAIWNLPLVGRVAAGQPIEADAHIEREIAVDRHLFSPRPHYLLRVHGMSMRDAGILDRDLIAVHRTPEAGNGQIVVARIEGEITVKRLHRSRKQIVLLPENPDFEPIEVDPKTGDFAIEGLYVGVIRLP
ncbi:MAG TPA: transcriptional repressor LexA [Rudaea sp.]|jgi:repressor LexA|uniref:transcriptional repressor LexA n=1 Tax=Rudaea sp. TaxID=2136325 RepID=UPI002F92FC93